MRLEPPAGTLAASAWVLAAANSRQPAFHQQSSKPRWRPLAPPGAQACGGRRERRSPRGDYPLPSRRSLGTDRRPTAEASPIDFTGVNASAVSSPAGQNFSYSVGNGPESGILNVRLISGGAYSLTTGSSPDPLGFYVMQSSSDLSELVFRFSFDTNRQFFIDENESQTALELNSFSLQSGTWDILSTSNTSASVNGSTVVFSADNNSPPYGHYSIAATGTYFDYLIKNTPAWPGYGSAISVRAESVSVPEIDSAAGASALSLAIGSIALLKRRRIPQAA